MSEKLGQQFHFIKESDLAKKFVPIADKELTRDRLKAKEWEEVYGLVESDYFAIGEKFNFPVIDPQGGFMVTTPGPGGSFLVRFNQFGNEKQIKELKMSSSGLKFSPDGGKILYIEQSISSGTSVVVINRSSQPEGRFLQGNHITSATFFGNDEKIVANLSSQTNTKIVIVECKQGKQIFAKEELGIIFLPRQNNDGKNLVYRIKNTRDELKLWNIETGESREYSQQERIVDVILSPSGQILLIQTDTNPNLQDGRKLEFYALKDLNLKKIGEYLCQEDLKHLSFSNDGSQIITRAKNGVKIFSLAGKSK